MVEAALPNATENVRQLVVDKVVKPLLANIDRSTAEKTIQLNINSATGYAVWRAIEACPWLSAATKISNLTSLSLLPARAIVLSAAVWIAGPAVQKGIELVKNDEAVLIAQYKAAILSRNPGLQKIAEDIQNGEQGKKALEALIQSTLEKQITKIILLGSEEAAVQKVADLKS